MAKSRKTQSTLPTLGFVTGARVAKQAAKNRTSTKEQAVADSKEAVNNLVDSLRPGLLLVFIGLNPGIETGRTGHAYAHKTNKFWPFLHKSGVTSKQHEPSETRDLMDLYSIGNTNIVARATRNGSTLTKAELAEGAEILDTKVRAFKPEAVAIVGKQIWEAIWLARTGKKLSKEKFRYGWQDDEAQLGRLVSEKGEVEYEGAKTYVATTTSALYAQMSDDEKLEIWKPLGDWVTEKRQETAAAETSAEQE